MKTNVPLSATFLTRLAFAVTNDAKGHHKPSAATAAACVAVTLLMVNAIETWKKSQTVEMTIDGLLVQARQMLADMPNASSADLDELDRYIRTQADRINGLYGIEPDEKLRSVVAEHMAARLAET